MSRSHLAVAVALLIAGILGAVRMGAGRSETPAAPAAIRIATGVEEGGTRGRILVHVAGAVRRPGVYRLAEGARVDDAVRRAGGATARGDLSAVNLAARVEDGRQVLVPARAQRPPAAGGVSVAADGAGTGASPAPVNLNTATLEQLDTLDGVGPATAQKILAFREERGGFGSVEELGEIPGIGQKRLATLRAAVTL